jgi:hypothetical protein
MFIMKHSYDEMISEWSKGSCHIISCNPLDKFIAISLNSKGTGLEREAM